MTHDFKKIAMDILGDWAIMHPEKHRTRAEISDAIGFRSSFAEALKRAFEDGRADALTSSKSEQQLLVKPTPQEQLPAVGGGHFKPAPPEPKPVSEVPGADLIASMVAFKMLKDHPIAKLKAFVHWHTVNPEIQHEDSHAMALDIKYLLDTHAKSEARIEKLKGALDLIRQNGCHSDADRARQALEGDK